MESTLTPTVGSEVDKWQKIRTVSIDFISGSISAATAKTAGAPFERVKLLLQTRTVEFSQTRIHTLGYTLFKEQGLLSFWRGNLPNVIRYFPMQAFMLSSKEQFRIMFAAADRTSMGETVPRSRILMGNMLAGGIAGVFASTLVYPLDTARTRLAADMGSTKHGHKREFNGMFDCLKSLYRQSGNRITAAWFPGWVSGCCAYFVYRGLQIGLYDTLKTHFKVDLKQIHRSKQIQSNATDSNSESQQRSDAKIALIRLGLSTGVTSFAVTIAYPLDTIRRRSMMLIQSPSVDSRKDLFSVAKRIIEESGSVKGLYRGLVINYVRGVGAALVLVGFDTIKPFIHRITESTS